MRTRLITSLALALFTTATASAQGPPKATARPTGRVRVTLPGFSAPIALDTVANVIEVKSPIGKVWAGAADAMKQFAIPVEVRDSLAGLVGSTSFAKSRSIAGAQMSATFNCGTGITGPNADNYRVNMAVMVLLESLGPEVTKMQVAVVGSATDVQGSSKNPVICATTGSLEGKIERHIKTYLINR